jgi:hypothetical protein
MKCLGDGCEKEVQAGKGSYCEDCRPIMSRHIVRMAEEVDIPAAMDMDEIAAEMPEENGEDESQPL